MSRSPQQSGPGDPRGPIVPPLNELTLGYLLSSSFRLVHQILLRRLAPHQLTPPQFGAVMLLLHAPGRTLGELARYTMGDSPTLCRILDRLERRGLVRREKDEHDRRCLATHLTERGRKVAGLARTISENLEAELLADFDSSEIETLHALLARVLRNAITLSAKDQELS